MKKLIFASIVLSLFSAAVFADIPRPKPTPEPKPAKSIETTLFIRLDRDAKEARIVIPKSQIKQLRAQLDEIDGGEDNTAAAGRTFTGTQTIVSGVFLMLAFVFGGVWLARSGKMGAKTGKIAGVGAFVFLSGALATVVFANIGPPIEARSITGRIFNQNVHMYKQASGAIRLEMAETGDLVELVVPDPKDPVKPQDEE
jgi:hypothetical protein